MDINNIKDDVVILFPGKELVIAGDKRRMIEPGYRLSKEFVDNLKMRDVDVKYVANVLSKKRGIEKFDVRSGLYCSSCWAPLIDNLGIEGCLRLRFDEGKFVPVLESTGVVDTYEFMCTGCDRVIEQDALRSPLPIRRR